MTIAANDQLNASCDSRQQKFVVTGISQDRRLCGLRGDKNNSTKEILCDFVQNFRRKLKFWTIQYLNILGQYFAGRDDTKSTCLPQRQYPR